MRGSPRSNSSAHNASIPAELSGYGRAAPNAIRIVDTLYQKPLATSQELQKRLSLSRATCDRFISTLVEDEILRESSARAITT